MRNAPSRTGRRLAERRPDTHPHPEPPDFTLGHQQVGPLAPERRAAYTLMEVMVATTMTAALLVCVLTGTISLQHAYAATEEYSAGQDV